MYIQVWETNVALPYALISQYTWYSSVLGTMHSVKQRIPDHENHYHFNVTQGTVNLHNVQTLGRWNGWRDVLCYFVTMVSLHFLLNVSAYIHWMCCFIVVNNMSLRLVCFITNNASQKRKICHNIFESVLSRPLDILEKRWFDMKWPRRSVIGAIKIVVPCTSQHFSWSLPSPARCMRQLRVLDNA